MKVLIILLSFNYIVSNISFSQEDNRPEIGIEGYASASNLGGAYSFALKYGHKVSENFVVGPSFRSIKSWSNNVGNGSFTYSIIGFGGFAHIRYGNTVFLGVEYELFKTPMNKLGFIQNPKSIANTLFFGGGFSKEFKQFVRVNCGIFYDALNQTNSPFRTSYATKKTNPTTGQVIGFIPIIYRLTFFFPIGKIKDDEVEEEN